MRRLRTPFGASLLLLALTAAPSPAQSWEMKTIDLANDVIRALADVPLKCIPPALMRDARAVAIIPDAVKVGFLIGGRFGRGVLLVRRPDGCWSDPVFITM